MFRRFIRAHRYTDADGRAIAVPRGWAGDVTDEVAKEADKAGVTALLDTPAGVSTETKSKPAGK